MDNVWHIILEKKCKSQTVRKEIKREDKSFVPAGSIRRRK
jgi:hypothetical protein